MATIRRLADSCLCVTTDAGTTLLDPGFFSYQSGAVDLETLGDVQRVLITHEHGDHVAPGFVRWLVDRGTDVVVHGNQAVVDLLAREEIGATGEVPEDTSIEDSDALRAPGRSPPCLRWPWRRSDTEPLRPRPAPRSEEPTKGRELHQESCAAT